MSIAKEIAPHLSLSALPRAHGTQASGDAHVVAMLEASRIPLIPARPRSAHRLYRTFLRLWSSAGVDAKEAVDWRSPAERN